MSENKQTRGKIQTTGQLRQMLVNAAIGVLNGDMDLDRAMALHKLSKNITESLYSETKIAMFQHEAGRDIHEMGSLPIGDTTKTSSKE